jgi:hypothetical protein
MYDADILECMCDVALILWVLISFLVSKKLNHHIARIFKPWLTVARIGISKS